MGLSINFVIMGQDPNTDPIQQVTQNIDLIMDESGFTNWGDGKPDETRWLNIIDYIVTLQEAGKGYPY